MRRTDERMVAAGLARSDGSGHSDKIGRTVSGWLDGKTGPLGRHWLVGQAWSVGQSVGRSGGEEGYGQD